MKPVLNGHSKTDKTTVFKPCGYLIHRSKELQNDPREHSAILLTCIKPLSVLKTYFCIFFELPLKTGFTLRCFQTEPDFLYIVFSTFNEFVECIADELLTGDNREEMESCMGNLQTFFERHRQNLTRSFPELAEFKVFECLGKRILHMWIQSEGGGWIHILNPLSLPPSH